MGISRHPGHAFAASEVGVPVDGKQLSVERKAPYTYGDEGNYLVTSFLEPAAHDFIVRGSAPKGRPPRTPDA